MRFLDFLFWHYYSYSEQCRKREKGTFGDSRWMSIVLIVTTIGITLMLMLSTVDQFLYPLDFLPKDSTIIDTKIFSLTVGIPCFALLYFRYYKQNSIVQDKYKIFSKRWGIRNMLAKRI